MLEEHELGLIMASKTLRTAFEQGREEGREEGRKEALSAGMEQLLRRLFTHRLG